MESCLSTHQCPAWCKEQWDADRMSLQLFHPCCSCVYPLVSPFDHDPSGVSFCVWASGLYVSERKLHESLILEVDTTKIGPTLFFHNYPQPSNKDSYRKILILEEWGFLKNLIVGLWKIGCKLILSFNIFTQEESSANCCFLNQRCYSILLKAKP